MASKSEMTRDSRMAPTFNGMGKLVKPDGREQSVYGPVEKPAASESRLLCPQAARENILSGVRNLEGTGAVQTNKTMGRARHGVARMPAAIDRVLRLQIAARLKHARERLLYTSSAMSREMGVTPQRWHNYENANRPFDLPILIEFCRKFGLTTDYLLTGAKRAPALAANVQRMLLVEPAPKPLYGKPRPGARGYRVNPTIAKLVDKHGMRRPRKRAMRKRGVEKSVDKPPSDPEGVPAGA